MRHPPKPETKKRWEEHNKAVKARQEAAQVQSEQGATVTELKDDEESKDEVKKLSEVKNTSAPA